MKKYLSIFAVLLLFSSCIKVENINLCSNPPQSPQIVNTNYLIAPGGTLNSSIFNPNPAYTYKWLSPVDSPFTGANLAYYDVSFNDYGMWSVFAESGFACVSDTFRFYVAEGSGSCGVGRDTFSIAGTPYPMTSQPATIDYYGNYSMNFNGPYGVITANIVFPSQPTAGTYTAIPYQNQGTLYSGQCSVSFSGGYVYSSNSGTVSVQVNGPVITVNFCNVQFTNYGNYSTAYGDGYLIGS